MRILIPDGWYHVFGRGWERRAVFRDDRDREHFLELLGELCERYRFVIHAYALMTNHHHLIVQTPEANLSAGMQWFNGSYSAWFNARHQRVGALWQGRYRDVLIDGGNWAYPLSMYIHLNPLRIAGLGLDKRGRVLEGKGFREPTQEQVTERLRRLRAYRWSSYRAYGGYCRRPSWLTIAELLSRAGEEPARQRQAYRDEVKQNLTYGVAESRVERLRDVVAIGSAAFAQGIRQSLREDLEGLSGKGDLRRHVSMEDVRACVERLRGAPWEDFGERRGDWGRDLFLWGVRRRCGVTLREAGAAVGGMKPTAVDMALRRFEKRMADNGELREKGEELLKLIDGE